MFDQNIFEQKWSFFEENFTKILEHNDNNICYQELYETINDLILLSIPKEKIQRIERIIINFSEKCAILLSNFSEIKNPSDFFIKFNEQWLKIKSNFNILGKILIRYERNNILKNLSTNNTLTICKIFY